MKIKNFVEKYNAIATDRLKEDYLKNNLHIKTYLPFLKKDAIARVLVDRSTYKYENYTKEDGTIGSRKTDEINVNSVVQYILFCRVIIENYTDLEVETEGFFEEYDALKQSGLLDKLIVGSENVTPMIPISEISELRTLVDMKQKDEIFNNGTPQSFISNQVERFGTLIGVTLNPVMEKISEQLENMTEEDVEKFANKFEKILKRVK